MCDEEWEMSESKHFKKKGSTVEEFCCNNKQQRHRVEVGATKDSKLQ